MIEMTDDARKHLDDYLRKTRSYLQGCKSVDAGDIEQNINEHIENELAAKPAPVCCAELDEVLERLGSPRQWVPEEELSEWRKFVLRLRTGPEDWTLAYISFGLFVVAFVTRLGLFVLLPASFLLARAAVSAAESKDQLGAQKWLLYPSLIAICTTVTAVLLFWQVPALVGIADGFEREMVVGPKARFDDSRTFWLVAWVIVAGATGLWWITVTIFCRKWPKFFKTIFYPFEWLAGRKTTTILLWTGAALLAASLACIAMFIA